VYKLTQCGEKVHCATPHREYQGSCDAG
jgi:hypothetical protein